PVTVISPYARSAMTSSSSALLGTYPYSDIAVMPSSSASLRMDRPPSPSRSARPIALVTICSPLRLGRGPRRRRSTPHSSSMVRRGSPLPLYALPLYALPLYALPLYALPLYALPLSSVGIFWSVLARKAPYTV